jgi:E3 ubiquitin-protein ligase XIAP
LEYCSYEKRLSSFSAWPTSTRVLPEALATAGFFFIGENDFVKCFSCDGGLKDWVIGDSPWIEHALFFPDCLFVQLNKGQAFIKASLQQHVKQKTKAAVEVWKNSDIVRKLKSTLLFSDDTIASVLTKRWESFGEPYFKYRHLFDDVSKAALVSGNSKVSPVTTEIPEKVDKETDHSNEDLICNVCLDRKVRIIFLPCQHMVTCPACASVLSTCPLCRSDIKAYVKPFF